MGLGTIQRTVRFFAWESIDGFPDFNLNGAVETIEGLGEDDWRHEARDMTTAAIVDGRSRDDTPALLRFYRLREGDDVPHKMDLERATVPIEIGEGESITDWTHVVIWPDGYAGHDPHRDAPSLTRLSAYFRRQTGERVTFAPLYDRDLLDQLRSIDDLRGVDLRIVKADELQAAEDARLGVFEGIWNMARESETATLAASLSVGRSRQRHLNPDVKEDLVALFESATEFLDRLVVRGIRNGQSVAVDLLHQRIEARVDVLRASAGARQPNPTAMYDAIVGLRRELEDDGVLARAARGRVG